MKYFAVFFFTLLANLGFAQETPSTVPQRVSGYVINDDSKQPLSGVNIINTNNLKSNTILTAENPLKNYQRPEIKNVTLKADDGTLLYGKIILPTNFDASTLELFQTYVHNHNVPITHARKGIHPHCEHSTICSQCLIIQLQSTSIEYLPLPAKPSISFFPLSVPVAVTS